MNSMRFLPRHVAYLICAVALVTLAPQTSDIATIRAREKPGVRPVFEYPVLARVLYTVERSVAPSRHGIVLTNAAVGVAAVVCITAILRRTNARVSLWMAAPTLMLAAVNVDTVTALFVLLGLYSWRKGRPETAGVWAGLGAAFKLAPVFILPPLMAASSRRDGIRMMIAAAVAWLATNVPYAMLYPADWRFPYEFAARRQDCHGTIWATLGLSVDHTSIASALALGSLCLAVTVATSRRRITPEAGSALTLLAFLAMNKIWQPHYLLWALTALALTNVGIGHVRILEMLNLAYFLVLWRQLPAPSAAFWMSAVGAARLAALFWVSIDLADHGRANREFDHPGAVASERPAHDRRRLG